MLQSVNEVRSRVIFLTSPVLEKEFDFVYFHVFNYFEAVVPFKLVSDILGFDLKVACRMHLRPQRFFSPRF